MEISCSSPLFSTLTSFCDYPHSQRKGWAGKGKARWAADNPVSPLSDLFLLPRVTRVGHNIPKGQNE